MAAEIINAYIKKDSTMKGKTTKASLITVRCELPAGQVCELRQKGMCRQKKILGSCQWGTETLSGSVTRRSASYLTSLKQFEDEVARYSSLSGRIPNGLYRIGGHILVEFPHVGMESGDKSIPWLYREGFLSHSRGSVILASDFTAEIVVKIATQRPYAMMGGVIQSYVIEVVPCFLTALRDFDRNLFDAALTLHPALQDKISPLDSDVTLITWADLKRHLSPRNRPTKVNVTLPSGQVLSDSSVIFEKGICLSVPIDVRPLVPKGAVLHSEKEIFKPTMEIAPDDASRVEFVDPVDRLRFIETMNQAARNDVRA